MSVVQKIRFALRQTTRVRHTVSTKLALYSYDLEKVLVVQYPHAFGLPGGHLETRELPEDCIRRELMEELGLQLKEVQPASFFLRSDSHGSVILGYTAVAQKNVRLNEPNPVKEKGVWVTKTELSELDISPAYQKFALTHWPTKKAVQ